MQKLMVECATHRGIPGMEHRTIREFGAFLMDMTEFVVFGVPSPSDPIAAFQSTLRPKREEIVVEEDNFEFYAQLFLDYWKWRSNVCLHETTRMAAEHRRVYFAEEAEKQRKVDAAAKADEGGLGCEEA